MGSNQYRLEGLCFFSFFLCILPDPLSSIIGSCTLYTPELCPYFMMVIKKQAHPKRFYGEAGNQSYHHLERTKDYQTACQIKLQLFIEHQAIRLGPNYSNSDATTSYMRGSRGGDQGLGPHPPWKITTL